jgi:hypothetical protein
MLLIDFDVPVDDVIALLIVRSRPSATVDGHKHQPERLSVSASVAVLFHDTQSLVSA